MEALLLIADALYRRADDALDFLRNARRPLIILVNALAANLAGEDDELGRAKRLAGDAGFAVFRQEQVDDSVADLVADLVRVAFGYRFGGEEIGAANRPPGSF